MTRRLLIAPWLIGFFLNGEPLPAHAADVNACIDECFTTISPSQNGGSTELRVECVAQCRKPSALYGAIAYGAKSTANGFGFDKPSQSEAERTAMVNCQQHGNDCKIVASFLNSCEAAAAVEAKGRFATGQGHSRAEVQNKAMAQCKAQVGGQCEIEVWTCAVP